MASQRNTCFAHYERKDQGVAHLKSQLPVCPLAGGLPFERAG